MHTHPTSYILHPTFLFAVILLAGCDRSSQQTEKIDEQPLRGIELTLAVVDDPTMAAAVTQLRGEWSAQTGAEFKVEQLTSAKLLSAERLTADAFIAPAYQLGELAERRAIAPLPNQTAFERGTATGWGDVFELLRTREAVWGDKVMGVPFGSPVFVVYYRVDLLKKLGRPAPRLWTEFDELARLLDDREKLGDAAPPADAPWAGCAAPLGPGWAGLTLLARAAPYAKGRSNYSTLFDIDTFEPLIASPPFVEALHELTAATKHGPKEQLTFDPAAARKAFWQGHCGMAISWPTAASELPDALPAGMSVGFVEMPGSSKVYDASRRLWPKRTDDEPRTVPLLSVSGRLGMLGSQSQYAAASLQLLLWLSSEANSTLVCSASDASTLFRKSQMKSPGRWTERQVSPEAAASYAAQTRQTLESTQSFAALPLPGRAEYLSALDEAVLSAVRGEDVPLGALIGTAQQWKKISEKLGVEKQKTAYRRSLGLEPF